MKDIVGAMHLVFSDKRNFIVGLTAGLVFGVFFALGSGMITFFPEGPFIEFNLLRITTFAALVILAGLVVPMQIFAIQKAKAGLKGSSSGVGGFFVGIASMSCCTPLLLPALLSFAGFSGTQLLFFNITIRQYVLPLSLFSVGLLFLSLVMVSRSVVASCRLDLKKQQ